MDTDKISYEPHHILEKDKDTIKKCICPKCGYETKKKMGVPCTSMKCMNCDTTLINK